MLERRQDWSVCRAHPAKFSALAGVWKDSVNHPTLPSLAKAPGVGARGLFQCFAASRLRGALRSGFHMAWQNAKAAAVDNEADVERRSAEGAAASRSTKFALKLPPQASSSSRRRPCRAARRRRRRRSISSLAGHRLSTRSATPAVKPAVFVDLPEVMVNLSNAGGERTQYLKVKIVLELPDQRADRSRSSRSMPRVMDAFQTYLRELRPSDLDGSAGLYRLKEELTPPRQRRDRAEPHQRRAVQGNRRPVTAKSQT